MLQGNVRMMFTGLRERLRSGELPPVSRTASPPLPADVGGLAAAAVLLAGEKHSEKDLILESEVEAPSPSCATEEDTEDVECGVCLDSVVSEL